jgi:hypothetical protein
MVKNVIQTVTLPATFLVSGFDQLNQETQKSLVQLAQDRAAGANLEQPAIDSLRKSLPEQMQKELDNYGVELPIDTIALTMRLGDFLYHLYAGNFQPLQAPLAIKRHEKKLQDLADALSQEEFEVPSDVVKIASDVMSGEKWATTPFGVLIKVDSKDKYIGVNHRGAMIFEDVINAAVAICS